MTELAVREVGGARVAPELATQIASFAMLEDVIRHAALRFVDIVVQDEYTHDVIVAAGDRFVVFDAT